MNTRQFDRAVARATGESLREVRRLGFSPADPSDVRFDPQPDDFPSQCVDWDALDAERGGLFP